tara:strand:- start:592 stop:1800 length:1209 start_codon:yes stop_codon:yes gene_type:complete
MTDKKYLKLKMTEKSVLNVYQKENPSTYRIEESEEEFVRVNAWMKKLFLKKLNFPDKMFSNSRLLDFGTGTGENSLHYILNGANGTFVEMNKIACTRAEKIFSKYAPDSSQYEIINKSLFDFKTDTKYDIVTSLGVIHHTDDIKKAFKHKVSFLKKGGFIVLGIANSAGFFQRNLQRAIIYHFTSEESQIAKLAEELFSSHLDRAEKYNGRTRKAIIYDTYVNPCINAPTTNELLKLFSNNSISLFSSWPPIKPPLLGDSVVSEDIKFDTISNLMSLPEIIWMAHKENDIEYLLPLNNKLEKIIMPMNEIANHLNYIKPQTKINYNFMNEEIHKIIKNDFNSSDIFSPFISSLNKLMEETKDLLVALEKNDLNEIKSIIENSCILFKGTVGVGMNYYIGYKD